MAYSRPVLCRFCGYPASDGGVLVSQVDREKLSEWCLRMLDTELDEEGLDEAVFCQLCVADARFEQQFAVDTGYISAHSGWWESATKFISEEFSLGGIIQPCLIQIECMSTNQIDEFSRKSLTDTCLKTAKKKRIHKCLYCPVEFPCKNKLKNHATQTHKDKPIFTCQVCSEIFKSDLERQDHCEIAHRDKFLCIYCGADCKYKEKFKTHMLKWHKTEAIQCKYLNKCTIFFKTEAEREEHVKKVHESGASKVKCVYCSQFLIYGSMKRHIRLKHRLEAIRCDHATCRTYFHTVEVKDQHFEQMHPRKRIECIYCRQVISIGAGEYWHMKKYHKSEAIKCNFTKVCPTYFLTHEDRRQHIQDVHKANILTKFKCFYCNKNCPDDKSLFAHVKYKHSDVRIKCSWFGCHQYFHSDADCKNHFELEHEALDQKNNLRCKKCSFKTSEIDRLNHHMKVKHGVEKLQCSQCSNLYRSKTALGLHKRKVHNPRMKCSVCLKTFKTLLTHLLKKECPKCDFVANCLTENAQHQSICAKENKKCYYCKETFENNHMRDDHILFNHIKVPSITNNENTAMCATEAAVPNTC